MVSVGIEYVEDEKTVIIAIETRRVHRMRQSVSTGLSISRVTNFRMR